MADGTLRVSVLYEDPRFGTTVGAGAAFALADDNKIANATTSWAQPIRSSLPDNRWPGREAVHAARKEGNHALLWQWICDFTGPRPVPHPHAGFHRAEQGSSDHIT